MVILVLHINGGDMVGGMVLVQLTCEELRKILELVDGELAERLRIVYEDECIGD